jgi:LPS-assembly lipoprotein
MWSPEVSARASLVVVTGKYLWVAVVSLLLGACGFHLRGSESLPAEMSVSYIHGTSEFGSLYDDFRTALESRGIRVTQDRGEATAVLNILESNTDKNVLTVDLAGKVLEYRISQNIQFEVAAADGQPLVDQQSVTANRSFKFNRNDVLGKERESELIRKELQLDVVNLAMLRIVAAARR